MERECKKVKRKIILVTAIGTLTATAIIQELLCDKEEYYIIGTDINPANQIVTSRDVDEFYVFPSAVDDQNEYRKFVLNFCETHAVEYLFPVIDEEVVDYAEHFDEFQRIGVKLCIPNKELIWICHYKNLFFEWITKNTPEIAIKTYSSLQDLNSKDFPVFIKPIEGRASNGCRKIKDLKELDQIDGLSHYIIQSYQEGDIVTADILRNAAYGQSQVVQRKELLRNKNGCGLAVKIIYNEQIEKICLFLAERLQLNGVVNAEFFVNDSEIKIIEINPRFSAGSIFSSFAGCNLAQNMIRIVDGESCKLQNIKIGKNYARRYEAYEL